VDNLLLFVSHIIKLRNDFVNNTFSLQSTKVTAHLHEKDNCTCFVHKKSVESLRRGAMAKKRRKSFVIFNKISQIRLTKKELELK